MGCSCSRVSRPPHDSSDDAEIANPISAQDDTIDFKQSVSSNPFVSLSPVNAPSAVGPIADSCNLFAIKQQGEARSKETPEMPTDKTQEEKRPPAFSAVLPPEAPPSTIQEDAVPGSTNENAIKPKYGFLYRKASALSASMGSPDVWTKLWCILQKRRLYYYESKSISEGGKEHSKGYLDLDHSNVVVGKIEHKCFRFTVNCYFLDEVGGSSFTTTAQVEFYTESDASRASWVSEIKSAIRGVQHQDPICKSRGKVQRRSSVTHDVVTIRQADFTRKKGALYKEGNGKSTFGRKSWKLRWFDMDGSEIRYYARPDLKPSSLKGKYMLTTDHRVRTIKHSKKKHIFQIEHPTSRCLVLVAESSTEMNLWVQAIEQNINAATSSAPSRVDTLSYQPRFSILSECKPYNTHEESTSQTAELEKIACHAMDTKSQRLIESCFNGHFLFSGISNLSDITERMIPQSSSPGDVVVWQTSIGDSVFVIDSGCCEVLKDEKVVSILSQGMAFGEMALILTTGRAATVRARSECKLWTTDRRTFRTVVAHVNSIRLSKLADFLQGVELLKDLRPQALAHLATALSESTFDAGTEIVQKGKEGDTFFIVKEGCVAITSDGEELSRCGPGGYFGEISLIRDETHPVSVIAKTDVICYTLDRQTFDSILGPLCEVLEDHAGTKVLRGVRLLDDLADSELDKLSRVMKPVSFSDKSPILKQGELGDTFYIITKGEVVVTVNDWEVGRLGIGQYFGEMALLRKEARAADVAAVGDVECYEIHRNDFNRHLGPLEKYMKREAHRRTLQAKHAADLSKGGPSNSWAKIRGLVKVARQFSNNANECDAGDQDIHKGFSNKIRIQLCDMKLSHTLGVGSCSRVKLAHHLSSSKPLAVKVIAKQAFETSKPLVNLKQEIFALDLLQEHPFIIEYYGCLQDKKAIYIVLELATGNSLWHLIHSKSSPLSRGPSGGLRLKQVRFYSAIVYIALQFIHSHNLVYRDLKPENCVIDESGYLKLVDFEFTKQIDQDQRTFTLCGTAEYIAPEVLLGKGHNISSDYWCFGILLYELVVGKTPFEDDNPARMFANISNSVLTLGFPPGFDPAAESLIQRLLHPNPAMRLGCLKRGAQDIRNHTFFHEIDWAALERRAIAAPHIPHFESTLSSLRAELEHIEEDEPLCDYSGNISFAGF